MESQGKVIVNLPEGFNQPSFELVIREGVASRMLDADTPRSWDESGCNLDGLFSICKQLRLKDAELEGSLVVKVNRDKGTMVVIAYPQSSRKCCVFSGGVSFSDIVSALKINAEGYDWTPESLAEFFKLNKHIFANPNQNMLFVSALKNLTVKSNSQLDQIAKDQKGNNSFAYAQIVESNIPEEAIVLNTELFKGMGKATFAIELYVSAQNGSIRIKIQSSELEELKRSMIDAEFTSCIDGIREAIGEGTVFIEQ